jgi:hypothetical protein
MNMKTITPGLDYYIQRIKSEEPFSFVRYGDGEWSAAILKDRPRTGSGSQALDDVNLQHEMQTSLKNPPLSDTYIMALRPGSVLKSKTISQWLTRNVSPEVQWHDCRVFAHASIKGELYPLIETLKALTIPLVFVGPSWLEKLGGIFPNAYHLQVPDRDAYRNKQFIYAQILGVLPTALVSLSVGPTTKILISQLFPMMGHKTFLLDFGSLWDVFCNCKSRSYHRSMKPATYRRNLTGQ